MANDSGSAQTTSAPWGPQADRIKRAFRQTDTLFGATEDGLTGGQRQYFPGQSYVGFSPETESSLKMTADRAMGGSPTRNAGNQLATKTLQGDFLGGNPYLDAVYNRGARSVTDQFNKSVMPSINSTFAAAGRYGSNNQKEMMGQAQDNLSRTLSEMAADVYAPAYEAERGRQMQTMSLAPSLASADYMDAQQLGSVGAQRESLAEAALTDQMSRFYAQQDEPVNAVQRYLSLLNGNYGGTQSQPIYRNRAAGALGGGLAGAQMGSMIMPGFGTAIGALGGAFLGAR